MKTILLALTVAVTLAAAVPTRATTYTVRPDGTGDFPTISDAVLAAVDGDIVELTDGIFNGDGNHDLDFLGKAITVRSQSGNPESCIIDCEGLHRGFSFTSGEGNDSVLRGIHILNGFGFGAAIDCASFSSPTIVDCVFEGGSGGNGGGLRCHDASPSLIACTFKDNVIAGSGGAAAIERSSAIFERCRFLRNSAVVGGGIVAAGCSIMILDCVFDGNRASNQGGGVLLSNSSALISGCTFVNGWASEGNGLYSLESEAFLERSIIANSTYGVAVSCEFGGTATLSCCDIYGNLWGDWVGCIEDQLGTAGNFSMDPLFCNLVNQRPFMLYSGVSDYALRLDSPCLPGNHPDGDDCDLIGAVSLGCGAPPIGMQKNASAGAFLETTWGRLKTGYR